MQFWGDCSATENDDGTWTYSINRKPVSFAPNVYPVTTGNVFIIEGAKGDLGSLGSEKVTDFPVVGTVGERYRVYRIVGTHCVIQYFSTAPWNPVGSLSVIRMHTTCCRMPDCRSCSPPLTTRINQYQSPAMCGAFP